MKMASKPREGTFEYMVRDVADREGWTERKAAAILKDGIVGGHDAERRQRRLEKEGIESRKK